LVDAAGVHVAKDVSQFTQSLSTTPGGDRGQCTVFDGKVDYGRVLLACSESLPLQRRRSTFVREKRAQELDGGITVFQ
jgi:hypothetical protein